MKILVAYYSRTGHTKQVAQTIAQNLSADIDEIIDQTDRGGIRGWLGGGKDALFKNDTDINYLRSPENYDLVIIGTPVWCATMTPAIRAYLQKFNIKQAAFYCTFGGNEGNTFKDMSNLSWLEAMATLGLKDKEVVNKTGEINDFCEQLK